MGANQSKSIAMRLSIEAIEAAASGRPSRLIREAAKKANIELSVEYIPNKCPLHAVVLVFDPQTNTYKCPHPLCETRMSVPGLADNLAAEKLFRANQGRSDKRGGGNKVKRKRPKPKYQPQMEK